MWQPINYVRVGQGAWLAQAMNPEDGRFYQIEVKVDGDDVSGGWVQGEFDPNVQDDMARKAVQEGEYSFEDAFGSVLCQLEADGEILRHDDCKWAAVVDR